MMNYMKNLVLSLVDADDGNNLSRVTVIRVVGKKLNTSKFNLIDFESEPLIPDNKFIEPDSFYRRLHCKIKRTDAEQEETVNFIYKLQVDSLNNTPIIKIINFFNGIDKEGRFYKNLSKNESKLKYIPKVYEISGTHIILDDDFSDYELCRKKWYGCKHFQTVLDTIAGFHAFSYHLKHLHQQKRERPFLSSHKYMLEEILYNDQFTLARKLKRQEYDCCIYLIDMLNEHENLKNELKVKFKRKYEDFYTSLKSVDHKFNVFSYLDPWGADSFLFKYVHDIVSSCRIFDFTFVRYLPPAHDVLSVLYYNSSPKFREEHSEFLLNYYYQQLTERLKEYGFDSNETYPKHAYERSCYDRLLTILYHNVNYKLIALLGKRKFNEYFKSNDMIIEYLLIDRVKHVEALMNANVCYKGNVQEEFQMFVNELLKI